MRQISDWSGALNCYLTSHNYIHCRGMAPKKHVLALLIPFCWLPFCSVFCFGDTSGLYIRSIAIRKIMSFIFSFLEFLPKTFASPFDPNISNDISEEACYKEGWKGHRWSDCWDLGRWRAGGSRNIGDAGGASLHPYHLPSDPSPPLSFPTSFSLSSPALCSSPTTQNESSSPSCSHLPLFLIWFCFHDFYTVSSAVCFNRFSTVSVACHLDRGCNGFIELYDNDS